MEVIPTFIATTLAAIGMFNVTPHDCNRTFTRCTVEGDVTSMFLSAPGHCSVTAHYRKRRLTDSLIGLISNGTCTDTTKSAMYSNDKRRGL